MAGLDREAIYAALLARLQGVTSLTQGVSRRLPPAVPPGPAEQPCAFVPAGKELPQYVPQQPMRWVLHTAIILYARTDDPSQAPSSLLAPLVKDVETALQWQAGEVPFNPGGATTLGGKCVHCAIGDVEYGEGTLDGQGVAFIPLEILAVSPT